VRQIKEPMDVIHRLFCYRLQESLWTLSIGSFATGYRKVATAWS
jgi:hypothetical protein